MRGSDQAMAGTRPADTGLIQIEHPENPVQFGRQRCFETKRSAGCPIRQTQKVCMQEHAAQTGTVELPVEVTVAVPLVAPHRMTGVGCVHADLMRSARSGTGFQQGAMRIPCDGKKIRPCRLTFLRSSDYPLTGS